MSKYFPIPTNRGKRTIQIALHHNNMRNGGRTSPFEMDLPAIHARDTAHFDGSLTARRSIYYACETGQMSNNVIFCRCGCTAVLFIPVPRNSYPFEIHRCRRFPLYTNTFEFLLTCLFTISPVRFTRFETTNNTDQLYAKFLYKVTLIHCR